VVLEGEANAAADVPHVTVERAQRSGDEAVVETVRHARTSGRHVSVVTADRVLRKRVGDLGARAVGPRGLTRLL
jgi:rRNA-processing protein FCF1